MNVVEYRNSSLYLLDQRLLPHEKKVVECKTVGEVAQAISDMVVRGAPAIAIAGAYGMALAEACGENLATAYTTLARSRPTAVHLQKVLDRMMTVAPSRLQAEAELIHQEDVNINLAIGAIGTAVLPKRTTLNIYHHCNTGDLATGGWGTALGIVRYAKSNGQAVHVWVGETRPYLQGARLTAWELMEDKVPCTLVTDSMAGTLMAQKKVDVVLVGCDRVAANGDTANKIGTLSLAVLARHFGVPFYVAMPLSALDVTCRTGDSIPIEERPAEEMVGYKTERWAPNKVKVYNPGFDITPAKLISGWVTERGLWRPQ